MNSGTHKIRRAIISVSDKTGIIDFAGLLRELDVEIYSTGGTSKLLKSEGISVRSVTELTGFPEILDGRVKTLHPSIHAGILAQLDNPSHLEQLKEHSLRSIDLLVVNLYPFEETLSKTRKHEILIENIDIGGPAMLRAAAKNYLWTAPVVNPARYEEIAGFMKNNDCTLPENYRAELACEVFEHTSYYDSLIAGYMREYTGKEFPKKITIGANLLQNLRYGENPHQKAAIYHTGFKIFNQLHGKELSYNNFLDIDAASKLVAEFENPTVAIVKHTNPCGVGIGENLVLAYGKAFATDNASPFGGIIAVNRVMDSHSAEVMHSLFTEVIIAPDFTDEAMALLTKKRDRRLIKADFNELKKSMRMDIRSTTGGILMQTTDAQVVDDSALRVVTKRKPTDKEFEALMFGWKVAKHVKSNAVVYASGDRTLAIGAGQMSRVDSSRIAVEKAKLMGIDLETSVMASDAFFPFADSLMLAVDAGSTAVIQPGGSVRDEEVIKAADEHNIAMVFTGMRHFRH